jgi:hypothetical protein
MPQVSILCYHGVIENSPNGFNSSGKHLNVKKFENQMEFLARNFEVVSMQNIENYFLGIESLPKKSVAITFDDGYANNLWTAHPILERYGLNATIYLATEYINSPKIMWSDRLELALIQSKITEFEVMLDKIQYFDISNLTNKCRATQSKCLPKLQSLFLKYSFLYCEDMIKLMKTGNRAVLK